ncbi:TKL/LISK/LISK-DD1 protein kinase [Mycena venus]|uniref:TKL/LISK/LISK-DD1 protein kinase n=1 Tax=Mycena venus TaxID=2733690 RepID=A0A8H6Y5D1_9AGAR|nr:TKL/LISK/LISK-DD1 protein kinase [Mycena venus]
MHSDNFDVIPYEVSRLSPSGIPAARALSHLEGYNGDIKGDWKTIGSGSFGNVYKGESLRFRQIAGLHSSKATYLGIDVAIKEVIPSAEYDVAKYFEREWRLMKETRHPNCCLYIGLSRAPEPDNRIFIISEFIENGSLRAYIHDKTKPFPWRLRLSFATDIARALAYLHARRCIHRDLKGENILVTCNGRLKLTDFGFARITARDSAELKRLTFCGTDLFMSPEILLGNEYDLPTDIFSLGIIFCEIAARRLADGNHFKRSAPTFGIDVAEVHKLASPGCPPAFLSLAIDCLATDPAARPNTRDILARLRIIEADILARPDEGDDLHVGSVRLMTAGRRAGSGPRIPSFGVGVGKDIRGGSHNSSNTDTDDSEDELIEAVMALSSDGVGSTYWSEDLNGYQTLLDINVTFSTFSDDSTTVIPAHPTQGSGGQVPSLSPRSQLLKVPPRLRGADPLSKSESDQLIGSIFSIAVLDSYHASHSIPATSTTYATDGGSTIHSHGNSTAPLIHRFSLLKPGAKPKKSGANSPSISGGNGVMSAGWNPLDLFFPRGLLIAKCDICAKRLGWKPVLECDDCGLRWVFFSFNRIFTDNGDSAHVKCGEIAPRDCGVRPRRPGRQQSPLCLPSSPLSKSEQSTAPAASSGGKSKATSPTE